MSAPKIPNTPGLKWRRKGEGWECIWRARDDIVDRGFRPKNVPLWSGIAPTEIEAAEISDTCRKLQDEMLVYGKGGLPGMEKFNGTLRGLNWYVTKDGDLSCLELYERHYSCYDYKDGRKRSQFVGPGEHIVLRTGDADAMFVWRKFIDDSGQQGVNCAVFRNESRIRSSDLIRQADAVADFAWPGERHYTFVNSKAVRSSNPGFCFVAAGWRKCGMTKSGLLILERINVPSPNTGTP